MDWTTMLHKHGVIFDVDGVLVDSYHAHFRSWQRLADETGCHKLTESEFLATFGRTSREILAELSDGALHPGRIAELDDRKEQIFRDMLRTEFRAMPGAATLIDRLAESGFFLAAGSSGPPDNVQLVLDQLQRADRFDVVITGLDVTRGKPHPEVFLLCAERLGLAPLRCAVIEDAVVGIEAANRAGMTSVALVTPPRRVDQFPHADRVVESLQQLNPDLIRQWLPRF